MPRATRSLSEGLLAAVARARDFDAARFVRWHCDGATIGHVCAPFVPLLREPFWLRDAEGVKLHGDDSNARSRTMLDWIDAFDLERKTFGWRNELCCQFAPDGSTVLALERALLRPLGAVLRSAHVNAWVAGRDGPSMWVARRADTKPIDPGLLDGLIGGGIAGLDSAHATMVREAYEEAGVPEHLALGAQPAPPLTFEREVPHDRSLGVHRESMAVFDLELPADFIPRAMDGESQSIELWPVSRVVETIAAGQWTIEGGVAAIDFLLRRYPDSLNRHLVADDGLTSLAGAVSTLRVPP